MSKVEAKQSADFFVTSKDGVIVKAKFWAASIPTESYKSKPLVLFVHQYAVMGGHGGLMEGMARHISALGYDAVTFDLRGAGESSGQSSYRNKAEKLDVEAVLTYLTTTPTVPQDQQIFLVGSSAGAALAGSVIDFSDRIIGGLFIGYTFGFWSSFLFGWAHHYIKQSSKPKLFMVGTADEFTSMSTYYSKIGALSGSLNEINIIEGKNHFQIEDAVYDKYAVDLINGFIQKIKQQQE